jgi:hypothetical protein
LSCGRSIRIVSGVPQKKPYSCQWVIVLTRPTALVQPEQFVSTDSIVPGAASGAGGGAATLGRDAGVQLKALTVDFHEVGFVSALNAENQQRFWFQLSDDERQQASNPWGPADPQALNRYSYVLNNPLRYKVIEGHYLNSRGYRL